MTTYRAHPDMVARTIRGECILIPIARTMEALDSIVSLNETAAFIRARAAEGLDEVAIRAALAAAYEVSDEQAANDVRAVLDELIALGALQPEEATP
jgi:hypothetical protein